MLVRRIAGTLLVAMMILVGAVAAPNARASSPGAGIGIRLIELPGAPVESLGHSYIVESMKPGATLRRRVEIQNSTHSVANVSVYAAAAGLRRGAFTFSSGRDQNDLASWTSVSTRTLRLAPGASAVETVTISVPRRASAGERYAVVWAQVAAPAPSSGGVTLVNRVGVRVYLSVGQGGAPPASFEIGALTPDRTKAGNLLVAAIVRNNGRGPLELRGSLSLARGPAGLRAGPFAASHSAILASGTSERLIVVLNPGLPRGPWRATLQVSDGSTQRRAVAMLTFPPLASVAPAAKPAGRIVFVIAAALAVLLAVFAGVASTLSIVHRAH